MKKCFCVISLFFLFLFNGFSQNSVITYKYDYRGNRVERIIDLRSRKSIDSEFNEKKTPILDEIGERKISIYPNPTKGKLKVEIGNCDYFDNVQCEVFNISGTKLIGKHFSIPGSVLINLESQSNGVYILMIRIESEALRYKIIKN
ncbi:MAG: T9SS type A sorting domain-containing protein [Vallitalea sp.]|nr:T9SS type A sorting domain-containing protein [Vallitalea sp.]